MGMYGMATEVVMLGSATTSAVLEEAVEHTAAIPLAIPCHSQDHLQGRKAVDAPYTAAAAERMVAPWCRRCVSIMTIRFSSRGAQSPTTSL